VSEQGSSFFQVLIMVLAVLFVFFIIIIVAAVYIADDDGVATTDPRIKIKIAQSIKPVGQVNTKSAAVFANVKSAPVDGKATYMNACFACHGTGVAGAPKVADKGAWVARIKQGKATLYAVAIKGKGAMPPKGGHASLSDTAVKAAVDYMVKQSK